MLSESFDVVLLSRWILGGFQMRSILVLVAAVAAGLGAPAIAATYVRYDIEFEYVARTYNRENNIVYYTRPYERDTIILEKGASTYRNGFSEYTVTATGLSFLYEGQFNGRRSIKIDAPLDPLGVFGSFSLSAAMVTTASGRYFNYRQFEDFVAINPRLAAVGDFESDAPVALGLTIHSSGVPEPAAWAMMISGCGLVGMAMRRRPRVRSSGTV